MFERVQCISYLNCPPIAQCTDVSMRTAYTSFAQICVSNILQNELNTFNVCSSYGRSILSLPKTTDGENTYIHRIYMYLLTMDNNNNYLWNLRTVMTAVQSYEYGHHQHTYDYY